MNRRRFRRLVEEAVDGLPPQFRDHVANVAIVVEDDPTDEQLESVGLDPQTETLFGLYEGVPVTEREHNFGMALPDKVTLFYWPLVEAFPDPAELRDEIRKTLVHEIGHFFGMDDAEIEDLGY